MSPELLLGIDRSAGRPLRAQLESGLRDAIRSGRLRGGERLPSSRELARELGLSRGIVQECFSQLLAEGYLTSRSGSATRVADVGDGGPSGSDQAAPAVGGVATATAAAAAAGPRLIADFAPGLPDLASFPRNDWAWAVREACGAVASADLGYGDPRGSAVLREVLAGYLRRVRAAAADPALMIVSTGFAQGLNLVLRALALAALLTSGRYDRQLRRMRAVYGARRQALVDAFALHAAGVRLTGLAAGFQAVARLPAEAGEAAVIAAARDRGVGLHGLAEYWGAPGPETPPALVMGFGNTGERAIEPAIAAIADLLR